MVNTDGTTGGNRGDHPTPDQQGNPEGQADWIIDPEGAARAAGPPEVAGHGEAHGAPLAQPETVASLDDKDGANAIDGPEALNNALPPTP